MSQLTEKITLLRRQQRPVSVEDAAEIADWVNEGGAADPAGPPPIIEAERKRQESQR